MTSPRPWHWVGPSAALHFAPVLADRFATGKRSEEVRFFLKMLITPHLCIGRKAVIGIVPVARRARLWCSLVWLLTPRRNGRGTGRLPLALRTMPRSWRVVNFAVPASMRQPGTALSLGRGLLEYADQHEATLVAAARTDDSRLMPGYLEHGFTPLDGARHSGSLAGEGTVAMVRLPPSARGT